MKTTTISVIVIILLLGGVVFLSGNKSGTTNTVIQANNVTLVDGKQIIEISARGGYQPRTSVAKAGVPTIIRFKTSGTFDCSSFIRIPSLEISKPLPQTGSTDVDIGTQPVGQLNGSCGMGMYPFTVEFVDK